MWQCRCTRRTGGLGPPHFKLASFFNPSNVFKNIKKSVRDTDVSPYIIAFWNCEGIHRNQIAIQFILGSTDLICLSQLNAADLSLI